MKLALPRGTINLTPAVYDPVLDCLADGQPHTLSELAAKVQRSCRGSQFREVIRVLVGARMVLPMPAQGPGNTERCRQLNHALVQQAASSPRFGALASPQLGGGVPVSRFSQAFLAQYLQGERDPAVLAAALDHSLQANGERAQVDGKVLPSQQEQRQYLQGLAQRFLTQELPLLRGWGMLD